MGKIHDDEAAREPESSWIWELVVSQGDDSLERHCEREDLERARLFLEGFAPRERKLLELCLGLTDGRRRSLGEAARELGMTRERVRQIENKLRVRLRRFRSGAIPKDYFEGE